MPRRFSFLISGLLLVACAGRRTAAPPQGPPLYPEVFFDGQTHGRGVMVFRDGSLARRFEVESIGHAVPTGDFVIEQTIRFDDGEVQQRLWTLTKTDSHEYSGTLTGAFGPVRVTSKGSVLLVSYPLSVAPFRRMDQFLYLQPGGRTIINVGIVRVMGIAVRRLHEVIEIVDSDDQVLPVE